MSEAVQPLSSWIQASWHGSISAHKLRLESVIVVHASGNGWRLLAIVSICNEYKTVMDDVATDVIIHPLEDQNPSSSTVHVPQNSSIYCLGQSISYHIYEGGRSINESTQLDI